jgi:hypothetical protein
VIVMPWLEILEALVPVTGSATPLIADMGTNATPCAVNDGGPAVAARDTPAVAANIATRAMSIAGVGRRERKLRMDIVLLQVGEDPVVSMTPALARVFRVRREFPRRS